MRTTIPIEVRSKRKRRAPEWCSAFCQWIRDHYHRRHGHLPTASTVTVREFLAWMETEEGGAELDRVVHKLREFKERKERGEC